MTSPSLDQRVLFASVDMNLNDDLENPRNLPTPADIVLTADEVGLLRDGLGAFDMDSRWVVVLDAGNRLRLWRSWTGAATFEATAAVQADGSARITGLRAANSATRSDPPGPEEDARVFRMVLAHILDLLVDLRAGWGLYPPFPEGTPPSRSITRSWAASDGDDGDQPAA